MIIRKYRFDDCITLIKLFYNTVHTINSKDYNEKQLNAWAPKDINLEKWHESLSKNYTLVAEHNEQLVGFADMDKYGYLDRLYIHKDFQNLGIAIYLMNQLDKHAKDSGALQCGVYASITARTFFEKRGYKVEKENSVTRNEIKLKNYKMIKKL